MNAYKFRLQRILELRRTQFQLAESECQRAASRLQDVQSQNRALASRKLQTRTNFSHLPEVAGRELAPLTGWLEWTQTEHGRLMGLERTAAQELQNRRTLLVEAQRKFRLLEKLQDKRRREWDAAFAKEIEELAADSFNSRYSRSGRNPR